MKKFIGILILATSIGCPAYAQSFDPDNGTGNIVNSTVAPRAPADASLGLGGRDAYASSPVTGTTGGGSEGYNEMLRNW